MYCDRIQFQRLSPSCSPFNVGPAIEWGGGGGGGEGGGISLSSNGKIDMNACKIYIVPLNVATEFESRSSQIFRLQCQ